MFTQNEEKEEALLTSRAVLATRAAPGKAGSDLSLPLFGLDVG